MVYLDFNKLDEFIFAKMTETLLPGLSIAVVERGQISYSRGFGVRDLQYGHEATPRTLYEIGSVTKSFTALSIMQLMNQGKLKLDDPVHTHAPLDLKSRGEPVRIKHLLTHSSGIPSLGYVIALMRHMSGCDGKWLPIASYDDMFTFMADADKWAFAKPGERWFYNNEGYVVLGYIVEKLSGMSYEKYVEKNILKPLGLTRTFFKKEDVEADADVATPYIITRNGEREKSQIIACDYLSSDGGLVSNVVDVARYIIMYLNRGQHDNTTILPAELVEEMETPRISLSFQVFGGEAYGFGLGVIPSFHGYKVVGHGGGGFRSRAYMAYVPEKKVGIAVLTNASGYPLSQIGLYGLSLMLGKDPEELPFLKRQRTLKTIMGRYENYKGTFKVCVTLRNGLPCIEVEDRYRDVVVPLIPEKLEGPVKTFYTPLEGGKLMVEFFVDGENVDLTYERYRLKKVGPL